MTVHSQKDFDARVEYAHILAVEDIAHFHLETDPAAIERMAVELEAKPEAFDEGPEMALLVVSALRLEAARLIQQKDLVAA